MIQLCSGQRVPLDSRSYRLAFGLNACTWGLLVCKEGVSSRCVSGEAGIIVSELEVGICLDDIDNQVDKLCFYAERYSSESILQTAVSMTLIDSETDIDIAHLTWPENQMQAMALSLFEIYRHPTGWRLHCVLQGFAEGIDRLWDWYGVNESVAAKAVPPVESTVMQAIDCDRDNLISLTWSPVVAAQQQPTSLYVGESFVPLTDLRIGCFYQLKNGQSGMVQSIGESPLEGSYHGVPYVQAEHALEGNVEQLNINMHFRHKLYRYLIYILKWESHDNWADINALVKMSISGVTEQSFQPNSLMVKPIYAVAMLQFADQAVTLSPLDTYFSSFREMDDAYGWRLPWHAND